MEEDWPAYDIGPQKHIHALGVVSLNYNLFEGALWLIFERYLGIDGPFFFRKAKQQRPSRCDTTNSAQGARSRGPKTGHSSRKVFCYLY
jgi:hypothetical protein